MWTRTANGSLALCVFDRCVRRRLVTPRIFPKIPLMVWGNLGGVDIGLVDLELPDSGEIARAGGDFET